MDILKLKKKTSSYDPYRNIYIPYVGNHQSIGIITIDV